MPEDYYDEAVKGEESAKLIPRLRPLPEKWVYETTPTFGSDFAHDCYAEYPPSIKVEIDAPEIGPTVL